MSGNLFSQTHISYFFFLQHHSIKLLLVYSCFMLDSLVLFLLMLSFLRGRKFYCLLASISNNYLWTLNQIKLLILLLWCVGNEPRQPVAMKLGVIVVLVAWYFQGLQIGNNKLYWHHTKNDVWVRYVRTEVHTCW